MRRNIVGWSGPSPVSYGEGWPAPEALDQTGMETVKAAFVQATQRAASLNFDVVELHAAHGYLLHEFLSPLSNHRGNDYRIRFSPGGLRRHAGGLAGS